MHPPGPLSAREPPRHGPPRTGLGLDFALVLAAACAIGVYTVHQITDVWDNASQLGVSTWQLITGDGDATDKAGQFATSLWHQVVSAVIQGFLLLAATAFACHWACPWHAACTHRVRAGAARGALRAAARGT
ncbi:hypothetical protein [Streptomyces sp. HUAS TT7]|uniref:hypothetical protein n=1 Tax=Streptomyces sp. HUAS TT7 TaxID=3447507 RepID=UPI003F656AEA